MIRRGPKAGTDFISRSVIHRQVKRRLASESKNNISVGASIETAQVLRETMAYYKHGKKVLRRLEKGKTLASEIKKGNTQAINQAKITFKKDAKTAIKNSGKGIGRALNESLYTNDIADSGSGSLNMAFNAATGGKEAGNNVYRIAKKSKEVSRYINKNKIGGRNNSTQNKYNISAKRSISKASKFEKRRAGEKAARKIKKTSRVVNKASQTTFKFFAGKMGTAIKALVSNPVSILIIGGILIVLVLFFCISASVGNSANAPASFLLADKQVVENYIDKIENMDKLQEEKIEQYKDDPKYDDVVIEWMNELGAVNTNWQELISIIAVEFEQDVTFSIGEQTRLQELYDKLNYIKTREEVYYCSGCYCPGHGSDPKTYCSGCRCRGHLRLYVQVYCLDMEEIIDDIGLEEWEKEWVRNLTISDWNAIYPGISNMTSNELTPVQIAEIISNAPSSSATRTEIIETALSLVGRVNYFWGGKSSAGWNSQWGKSIKVTAPGNRTTGTYQAYGLDCSGFVDWVYKTAGVGNMLSAGGTTYQWSQSYAITKENVKIGDLVFKMKPGSAGINHVGIFVGTDSTGQNLYCHCTHGKGVVVNNYKGFKYYRRPFVNFDE